MKFFATILIFILFLSLSYSQEIPIQFYRPNSALGLNVFESTKSDTTSFYGLKVHVGGSFTQDYQGLDHENNAAIILVDGVNKNKLIRLKDGFNLAMANLNLDAQLADGIRLQLIAYLSSRHHEETWVKGGYIQFDKLSFLHSDFADNLMKSFTIRLGDYEVDYGDQHYRRTDGGNAIFNPFVENYIMDEFTTEIGGDIIFHPTSGWIASFGITNGQLNPTVVAPIKTDTVTGKPNEYKAAFHGKIGYDKQLDSGLRFRLTGSFYIDESAADNTLFFGDRAGSHYFYVLENTKASASENASSGRFDPEFTDQVSTFMINPFVKYKGVELFGTIESAKGRQISEIDKRKTNQYAVDLIYRFPQRNEHFWIGGRYNSITAEIPEVIQDVSIQRFAGSLGWFITKNILAKVEYVTQTYKDFPIDDIRSEGKFDGFMVEASVGF